MLYHMLPAECPVSLHPAQLNHQQVLFMHERAEGENTRVQKAKNPENI